MSRLAIGACLVGVITKVDSSGLNEVSSFDLRTADGTVYTFKIGDLENPTEFPPGHLREHMATSSPVRVFFEVIGDRIFVTRLEDGRPSGLSQLGCGSPRYGNWSSRSVCGPIPSLVIRPLVSSAARRSAVSSVSRRPFG